MGVGFQVYSSQHQWDIEVERLDEHRFLVRIGEVEHEVELERHRELYCMRWNGCPHLFTVDRKRDHLLVRLDGRYFPLKVLREGQDETEGKGKVQDGTYSLLAPMPGVVKKVLCKEGDTVEEGAPLVVMEAMKMEMAIESEYGGKVSCVSVQVGDSVREGDILVEVAVAE